MPSYQINVNGAQANVDAVPDMPLLWVLRDILGLTGSKYGCGIGACGACTVIMDGVAVRSCQVKMDEVEDKKIITIEGISGEGLHPVQRAWLSHDVPQCGYCQCGHIMEAAALLMKTKNPTDADIDDAFSGHICRCGTYQRIREAVKVAALESKTNEKPDLLREKLY